MLHRPQLRYQCISSCENARPRACCTLSPSGGSKGSDPSHREATIDCTEQDTHRRSCVGALVRNLCQSHTHWAYSYNQLFLCLVGLVSALHRAGLLVRRASAAARTPASRSGPRRLRKLGCARPPHTRAPTGHGQGGVSRRFPAPRRSPTKNPHSLAPVRIAPNASNRRDSRI